MRLHWTFIDLPSPFTAARIPYPDFGFIQLVNGGTVIITVFPVSCYAVEGAVRA